MVEPTIGLAPDGLKRWNHGLGHVLHDPASAFFLEHRRVVTVSLRAPFADLNMCQDIQ
jgi:hypothetical protein